MKHYAQYPLYVGIDPGQSGALAVIDSELYPIKVLDFSRIECADYLKSIKDNVALAFIELVHAMPKNGVVSMFRFGENFGWWQGVLNGLDIVFHYVPPQTWMKHFGLTKNSPNDKPSLTLCRKAFPEVDLSLKKYNGRSDALCIAAYAHDFAITPKQTL